MTLCAIMYCDYVCGDNHITDRNGLCKDLIGYEIKGVSVFTDPGDCSVVNNYTTCSRCMSFSLRLSFTLQTNTQTHKHTNTHTHTHTHTQRERNLLTCIQTTCGTRGNVYHQKYHHTLHHLYEQCHYILLAIPYIYIYIYSECVCVCVCVCS